MFTLKKTDYSCVYGDYICRGFKSRRGRTCVVNLTSLERNNAYNNNNALFKSRKTHTEGKCWLISLNMYYIYIYIIYYEISPSSIWHKQLQSFLLLLWNINQCFCLCVKDKWHLEDMHIVLGTADTVSGQWGQCDCSVSLVGRHWSVRWVWRNQGDTQTCQDSGRIKKCILTILKQH